MLKVVILILGLGAGAGATTSWLLSSDASSPTLKDNLRPDSLQARANLTKTRFSTAWSEGDRAGRQTESELQRRYDAYRRGSKSTLSS